MMCVVTERGNQCLLAWGRWARRDSTVRRLGYPSGSIEQTAGRVIGGDHALSDIEERVDELVASMLEDRKRLVARFFYMDRAKYSDVVLKIDAVNKERLESGSCDVIKRVSVSVVKDDLMVIRSMVGGVIMWSDKKVVDSGGW